MSLCHVNKRGSIVNNQGDCEQFSLVDFFPVQISQDLMNSIPSEHREGLYRVVGNERQFLEGSQAWCRIHCTRKRGRLPFLPRMYEDLVVQNKRNDWFASFKSQHRRGHFDAIFVQETHTKANDLTRSRVTTRLTGDIEQV